MPPRTLPAILFALLACLAGWGEAARAQGAENEQVSAAELARAKPGTIFRIWPLEGGVRAGYKGYRVLYRSTGFRDEPIAVSGAIMFPSDPGDGRPRPVVAWAHPTSGVVTRCAPSLMPDLAGWLQGIDQFTDAGYVIVATDYPGLGGPGDHPYLVGKSEARAVLDSVRAARTLSDTHAGHRVVVWGHSQGGHAALYTGIEARAYAPDLELLGVAAAAPATELRALFEADRNSESGRSLTAMALLSWSRVFALPLAEFVEPQTEPGFRRLASDCILSIADFMKEDRDEHALARKFLKSDPTQNPRVGAILQQNTPGELPAGMPVFIAQGSADTLVRPPITRAYAKRLCDAGARVRFHLMDGVSHMMAAADSAQAAAQWIADRFAGRPAPSDC